MKARSTPSGKKPAAKRTPAATGKKLPAKRTPAATAKKSPARRRVTPEERYRMIEERAYLRAEARGFEPGHELDDWIAAEAEVDALLGRR